MVAFSDFVVGRISAVFGLRSQILAPSAASVVIQALLDGSKELPTFRIYCSANDELSLTARNGQPCLAVTTMDDERQHWLLDPLYGCKNGDRLRCPNPAFALVNAKTKAAVGIFSDNDDRHYYQLKMVPSIYEPGYQDVSSLLWWEDQWHDSHGFCRIRWLNDNDMCLYFNGGDVALRKAKTDKRCLVPWKCLKDDQGRRGRLWRIEALAKG